MLYIYIFIYIYIYIYIHLFIYLSIKHMTQGYNDVYIYYNDVYGTVTGSIEVTWLNQCSSSTLYTMLPMPTDWHTYSPLLMIRQYSCQWSVTNPQNLPPRARTDRINQLPLYLLQTLLIQTTKLAELIFQRSIGEFIVGASHIWLRPRGLAGCALE